MVRPALAVETQVSIPNDASPIEFKPLHLKFGSDVFEVIGRSDVFFPIKEPFDWVCLYPHINGLWFEPLCLRRDYDPIALGTPGLVAQPLFRSSQIASDLDWVACNNLFKRSLGSLFIKIKCLSNELAERFGTEGTHRR